MKKKEIHIKLLSALLALVMIFGVMPISAFAEETEAESESATSEAVEQTQEETQEAVTEEADITEASGEADASAQTEASAALYEADEEIALMEDGGEEEEQQADVSLSLDVTTAGTLQSLVEALNYKGTEKSPFLRAGIFWCIFIHIIFRI